MKIYPKNIRFFFFPLLLILSSCEKINTDPQFDITPAIKLLEISHTELTAFEDQLIIKIEYEDGDGDLGNPNNDINSLFVKDSRLDSEDEYFVGPLAPVGSNLSITGTLNIELGTFFLLGNGSQEKTTLTIYMKDRAGNKSNVLETEPITIVK